MLLICLYGFLPAAEQRIVYEIVPGDKVIYFNTTNGLDDKYVLELRVGENKRAEINIGDDRHWAIPGKNPVIISKCAGSSNDVAVYTFGNKANPVSDTSKLWGSTWTGRVTDCGTTTTTTTATTTTTTTSEESNDNFKVTIGKNHNFGVVVGKGGEAYLGERIKVEGKRFYAVITEEGAEVVETNWSWGSSPETLPSLFSVETGGEALTEEGLKRIGTVHADASSAATFKIEAVPSDEPEREKVQADLKFHRTDMSVEGLDEPDEERVGKYIASGTNNLVRVGLKYPTEYFGEKRSYLKVEEGAGLLLIWKDAARTELLLPETVSEFALPIGSTALNDVYLEILSTTTNSVLHVKFYYEDHGTYTNSTDRLKLKPTFVNLVIDSGDTRELLDPEDTLANATLEEQADHPGKSLFLNHLDRDKDGVPDYADGYDKEFGGVSQADANASHEFVPLLLKIPADLDVNTAKIIFECDSLSNPSTDVNLVTVGGQDTYELQGSGRVRLWLKNGSEKRNMACVTSTDGDAILHGVAIPLSKLSPTNGVAHVYIEALKVSKALGDVKIKVKMNPTGTEEAEDFIATDEVKATVYDVEKVHPLDSDFDSGHEGRVLISAKHGGGFYTPYQTTYQTTNTVVNIKAQIKPRPPVGWATLKVYFEVTDPDDLSHYEGKTTPGTPTVQGDTRPNDNRDPKKRMTTGVGDDYTKYQDACLEARSAAVVVDPQAAGAFAETKLKITTRYAGDNYQVRATLQKPNNLERFDTRTDSTTIHTNTVSSIAQSATLIAWKRVYIELDKMYLEGATIIEDANAGDRILTVDSVLDFKRGDDVVVFWKNGSHDAKISHIEPTVNILGGNGSGAEARAEVKGGAITKVNLINPGGGYTYIPLITFTGNVPTKATATATMVSTGIQLEVLNGGTNYTVAPTLTLSAPPPGGTQATATASVNSGGQISVTVTNVGTGYRSRPTVTVAGGDGQDFSVAAWLQPTQIEKIDVNSGGGGAGYKCEIWFSDHPLPQNVEKYSGVRPKTEPGTYDVNHRYLTKAFGEKSDGSDGGAFIEFKDVATNPNAKIPKFHVFPTPTVFKEYANHWFGNQAYRKENVLYHFAANRTYTGARGWSYPANFSFDTSSISAVFSGAITNMNTRDDAAVHEIGHRFGLIDKGGRFDHIDNELHSPSNPNYIPLPADRKSHDNTNGCIMSYDRIRSGVNVEFSIPCLLSGSSNGMADSLRDYNDM